MPVRRIHMNLQRYKWPVLVAASLHGALFMSTREPSSPSTKTHVVEVPLPPIPKDAMIEVTLPEDTSGEVALPRGGPAVPVLPDVVVPLPDKSIMTTPVAEYQAVQAPVTSLKDYIGGPAGPGENSIPIAGIQVVGAGQLDRHPRAIAQISPDFPATMRQQGIAGSVTVEFDVDREGNVVRAEAIQSTRREFAEPALRAVRNWRFEPGRRNGRTVPFRMTVPIKFDLGVD